MGLIDDRAAVLDRTPWIRGMSWPQVRLLASYMTHARVEAGTCLIEEGARDASASVVVEGTVVVSKRDQDGVDHPLAEIGRGHCFGEISLLDGEPRSASVRASTPVELLTLRAADLERIADEKPRLAVDLYHRLGRVASQHLRRTSGRLVDALTL